MSPNIKQSCKVKTGTQPRCTSAYVVSLVRFWTSFLSIISIIILDKSNCDSNLITSSLIPTCHHWGLMLAPLCPGLQYMNTQSVLITPTRATLVSLRQTEWQCCIGLVAGGTAGETSLSEMTRDGSPPPPGQNIRGGESSMSWWMVEIGHSAIWTRFHGMINLSRGPWLSVIWNPLSMYLLHNTGYLLQLNLPLFL